MSFAYRSLVNYVAKINAGCRRTHRAAAHRQASLIVLDAFAIGRHCQTPLDIELCCDCAKACLDFVSLKPLLVEFLQFLEVRIFFAQKVFREYPAFVRGKTFRAHKRDRAALVVFANSFTCACSANPATNDEIITPNHMRIGTIISALPRRQAKSSGYYDVAETSSRGGAGRTQLLFFLAL